MFDLEEVTSELLTCLMTPFLAGIIKTKQTIPACCNIPVGVERWKTVAEWPENKLYAQWSESAAGDRGAVETKLYAAVKRHVHKVLWNELKEDPPDELVDKATAGVMTQLKGFRRACKFSTWVQEIAIRNSKQYIRGKVRERKVFDEYTAVVDSDTDDALDTRLLLNPTS